MAERFDYAVIGGGIVGLATATALHERHPQASIVVLEAEDRVGRHQSGHNSGVLHSGLYYAPGSLKARLCVEGRRRMVEFCEDNGIAHRITGKLVAVLDAREVDRLRSCTSAPTPTGWRVSGIWREEGRHRTPRRWSGGSPRSRSRGRLPPWCDVWPETPGEVRTSWRATSIHVGRVLAHRR